MINSLEVASDGYLTSTVGRTLLIATSGYIRIAESVEASTARIFASINSGIFFANVNTGIRETNINTGIFYGDINEG